MDVKVLEATLHPMHLVGIAAGTCYGKPWPSADRVRRCVRNGHTSVLEHTSATFRVEGISRSCLAQLTRHRIASYSVESQRYCEVGNGGDWYVVPPSIVESGMDDWYEDRMYSEMCAYNDALHAGVRKEDARYLLPMATKTNLVMTVNARSLQNLLELRLAKAAQWEIRQLAGEMERTLGEFDKEWGELVALLAEAREGASDGE